MIWHQMKQFAENYHFVVYDNVQVFNWNNAQAMFHPSVINYKTGGNMQWTSMCVISDYLKHIAIVI